VHWSWYVIYKIMENINVRSHPSRAPDAPVLRRVSVRRPPGASVRRPTERRLVKSNACARATRCAEARRCSNPVRLSHQAGILRNDPEPSPQTEGETRCAMWDREKSYRF
jgi:hypothetical protein